MVKRFWRYLYSFWLNVRTWQTYTDTAWRYRPRLCIASHSSKILMRILQRQFTAFMKKISVNSKTVLLSDFAQQHAYICTSEIFCTIWSRIHFWITWRKNYRNHSKSSKVIAKIYCHLFYRSQSIYIYIFWQFFFSPWSHPLSATPKQQCSKTSSHTWRIYHLHHKNYSLAFTTTVKMRKLKNSITACTVVQAVV